MSTNELREIILTVIDQLRAQNSLQSDSEIWSGCIFGDCDCVDQVVAYYGIVETDPNRKTP